MHNLGFNCMEDIDVYETTRKIPSNTNKHKEKNTLLKNKWKVITCLTLSASMISGCSAQPAKVEMEMEQNNIESTPVNNKEVTKPEKITIMVDGSLTKTEDGQDAFIAAWEELTGIDLEIIQPEHETYYDSVTECFENNDLPDVVLLSSTYYAKYASEDLLADITDFYESSELKQRISENGNDSLIDGIKIHDRIYGITHLPEFYQDAYPSFYLSEDGTWVDGFNEDSMKEAMERLSFAYESGYLDKDVLTNSTGDCRDKFYADEYGVFTYWAGTWAHTLSSRCKKAELDDRIIALPPIKEVGSYLERVAPVWCITSKCKNPQGVFTYFLETMLDSDEMQYLWTYSPASEDYSKSHLDHMLTLVPLQNDPKDFDDDAIVALDIFQENSRMADLPFGNDAYSQYNDELMSLKIDLINRIVTEGLSIEEAYQELALLIQVQQHKIPLKQ